MMVRIIFIFENSGSCSLIHVPGFANCIACMFQPNALDIGSSGAGVCYVTCDQHLRQCPWSWGMLSQDKQSCTFVVVAQRREGEHLYFLKGEP